MATKMPEEKNAVCPACGKRFHCGKDEKRCWCMDLPPAAFLYKGQGCVCEDCLRARLKEKGGK